MSKCALCKTSLKDDEINVCDKCRLDFLNFKQQLSEKDKEINKLQQMDIIDMQIKEILELQVATIRKQVCDEIREYIKKFESIENEKYFYPIMQVPLHTFLSHIDKIEQGEQQ